MRVQPPTLPSAWHCPQAPTTHPAPGRVSNGAASHPVSRGVTISGNPPMAKATTGVPHACDSMAVFGRLSWREGTIVTSAALYSMGQHVIIPHRPQPVNGQGQSAGPAGRCCPKTRSSALPGGGADLLHALAQQVLSLEVGIPPADPASTNCFSGSSPSEMRANRCGIGRHNSVISSGFGMTCTGVLRNNTLACALGHPVSGRHDSEGLLRPRPPLASQAIRFKSGPLSPGGRLSGR